MKVFIVFAHPERESLNGSLLNVTIDELEKQGHEVKCSDLYAMNWKACVDRADFLNLQKDERLIVHKASRAATNANKLTDDVKAEQEKLEWADFVIFQFPLWWSSMPAILKGWFERTFSCGWAYGTGEYNDKHAGNRYGEGVMLGKRAMLLVTIGSQETQYGPRGISGPIEDVLYPINHSTVYYVGFDVIPPFLAFEADRYGEDAFEKCASNLRTRMRTFSELEPISYRAQNFGDYDISTMKLKEGLEVPGTIGFAMQKKKGDQQW